MSAREQHRGVGAGDVRQARDRASEGRGLAHELSQRMGALQPIDRSLGWLPTRRKSDTFDCFVQCIRPCVQRGET